MEPTREPPVPSFHRGARLIWHVRRLNFWTKEDPIVTFGGLIEAIPQRGLLCDLRELHVSARTRGSLRVT